MGAMVGGLLSARQGASWGLKKKFPAVKTNMGAVAGRQKGRLRMKRKFKTVVFGAGKAFDDFGRATPFWTGVVAYRWNTHKQVFVVYTVQVLGTGTVMNAREYKDEVASCDEVNDFIEYIRGVENHYKKVYGE